MNDVFIGLNKRNNYANVYFDTSKKYKRWSKREKRFKTYYHCCWRADVRLVDNTGVHRIRKRFKTREDALNWLGLYY